MEEILFTKVLLAENYFSVSYGHGCGVLFLWKIHGWTDAEGFGSVIATCRDSADGLE